MVGGFETNLRDKEHACASYPVQSQISALVDMVFPTMVGVPQSETLYPLLGNIIETLMYEVPFFSNNQALLN